MLTTEDIATIRLALAEWSESISTGNNIYAIYDADETLSAIDHALAALDALEATPQPGVRQTEVGVRGGLIKGRIRTIAAWHEPSYLRPAFHDALQMATTDDLTWALKLLIGRPNSKRTWRTYRIQHIDKRIREILMAEKLQAPP
jgi:hypothetical protein